jgi:hypothetical protein
LDRDAREFAMNDEKKPKRGAQDSRKPPPPPGSDQKDKPVRDTREDPTPNPGGSAADRRPSKRP